MPAATTTEFTIGVLAVVVLLIGSAILIFGVPSEWKNSLYQEAAERMGEHKAKDLLQDQISKLPESDQKSANQISSGLGKLTGGSIQNPLGKMGKKND